MTDERKTVTWSILSTVPQQVSMNGKEYRLETSIWRDFMPICESSGRSMIAVLNIHTTDSSELPFDIKADQAWIIYGNDDQTQIRETPVVGQAPRDPSTSRNYLRVTARNRPKWGPNVNVDVVVRLKNSKEQIVLLQAKNQKIHRTD